MRTLQRRLSDMDTTFSAVIDTAQMRSAVQLLEQDDYSLAEIAHQLGYTDRANFTRAFVAGRACHLAILAQHDIKRMTRV